MNALIILFIATCFLAYSNGSNDNFKGVATLFGSGSADYKKALWWATLTTLAGSVSSIFWAEALLKNFSGKGLVPDAVVGAPDFLIAVAIGAGLTVILATVTGFPISTTHSLTGALVGAGIAAVGTEVNIMVLGGKFFLPLIVSPFAAVLLALLLYSLFRFIRLRLGISKEWCLCITESEPIVSAPNGESLLSVEVREPEMVIDTKRNCELRYNGSFLGVSLQQLLDVFHFLSAGVVSFARGLNDTPKIVALLLALQIMDIRISMGAVAAAIALGGVLNAKKVAHTISKKITPMNHGQGFTANLVTGFLVIFASRIGMPVSTTHVSVGALLGIGTVTGEGNKKVIREILLSWLLTLPIGASLAAVTYRFLGLMR